MEIARSAEAVIDRDGKTIVKDRIAKTYRIAELDTKIRKFRTKREAKILKTLEEKGFKVPSVHSTTTTTITMDFVEGDQVRNILTSSNASTLGKRIGAEIRKLHEIGICHGDLTTSNMIFGKELVLVDFGLAAFSQKTEDKAVDLHLLKQTLEAKHPSEAKKTFDAVLESYEDKEVISWLHTNVEARGRHKKKH